MVNPSHKILIKNKQKMVIYNVRKLEVLDSLELSHVTTTEQHLYIVDYCYCRASRRLYVVTNENVIYSVQVAVQENKFLLKTLWSYKVLTKSVICSMAVEDLVESPHLVLSGSIHKETEERDSNNRTESGDNQEDSGVDQNSLINSLHLFRVLRDDSEEGSTDTIIHLSDKVIHYRGTEADSFSKTITKKIALIQLTPFLVGQFNYLSFGQVDQNKPFLLVGSLAKFCLTGFVVEESRLVRVVEEKQISQRKCDLLHQDPFSFTTSIVSSFFEPIWWRF